MRSLYLLRLVAATLALWQVVTANAPAQKQQTPSPPGPGNGPSTIKIMTFNVRTAAANDKGDGAWASRKHKAEAALKQYAPDIIGTQETSNNGANEDTNQVKFFENRYAGVPIPDNSMHEKVAIWYDAKKLRLLESKSYPLVSVKYDRVVGIARFQVLTNGATICHTNLHFDVAGGFLESAQKVSQMVANFCKPEDLVVLTGDLNTTPETQAVQYLYGKANGPGGAKNPMPLVETMDNPNQKTDKGVAGFYAAPGKKIDYIMARADKNLAVQSGQVLDDVKGVTDHLLLMTTFCVGQGCTPVKKPSLRG